MPVQALWRSKSYINLQVTDSGGQNQADFSFGGQWPSVPPAGTCLLWSLYIHIPYGLTNIHFSINWALCLVCIVELRL